MQSSNHVGRNRREDLSPVRLDCLLAFRARRRRNLQEAAGIATISRNFRQAVWDACLAHLLLDVSPIDKGTRHVNHLCDCGKRTKTALPITFRSGPGGLATRDCAW